MTDFFKNPNLPDRNVTLAICGRHNEVVTDFIHSFGIELIFTEDCLSVDKPIINHADIVVHHAGGKNIIIDKLQHELYKILKSIGMTVIKTDRAVACPYPQDCILNCLKINDALFCKENIIDNTIANAYNDYKIANVNQGYCKCSTLLLNDRSFITDDISIYNKGKELSFNCILISKGDIKLNGYDYGFIGGASAKISNDEIVFFGDITKHKDFTLIDSFIKKLNMKYFYSDEFPLTDIGGLIQLK